MPASDPDRPFAAAWLRFIGAARRDTPRLPKHRALDQFIQLRNAALDEAESDEVASAINDALAKLYAGPGYLPPMAAHGARVAALLVTEANAYAAAVDVAAAEYEEQGRPAGVPPTRLARVGKSFVDSLREILDTLPPHVKALLKILSEVFEIFD